MEPRRKAAAAVGLAALLLTLSTEAAASCPPPRLFAYEPRWVASLRPQPPGCLRFLTHSFSAPDCDEGELQAYERSVDAYLGDVALFVEEARNFARAAADFALDAQAYANCEERELGRW